MAVPWPLRQRSRQQRPDDAAYAPHSDHCGYANTSKHSTADKSSSRHVELGLHLRIPWCLPRHRNGVRATKTQLPKWRASEKAKVATDTERFVDWRWAPTKQQRSLEIDGKGFERIH